MATLSPLPKFQAFDANGDPLVGGKLYTYAAGTTTPLATYTDEGGSVPNTNPVILDAHGQADVWLGAASYKLVLKDTADVTLWTVDNIVSDAAALALKVSTSDLGDTSSLALGDALVGVKQPYSGAVPTTQHNKNTERLDAVNDFGVDNTGASNCTANLLAFYNACILTGRDGKIPSGTYKVTTGVLVFDNNQTDKQFPNIFTDGYQTTIFQVDSATATNAPVLQWKNGTAASSTGHYWRGGYHGGISIVDSTGATAANRHGISLTGTWGLRFGYIKGTGIRGSLVCVPANLYGGSNPDPYASSYTEFEYIECNNAARYGLENLNYVGMDSWYIHNFRAVGNTLGGWFGIGSGCKCDEFVCASGNGWAFDDGTQAGAPGGPAQRNFFGVAELDNVENGIRLNKSSFTSFKQWRFVHRFQTSPNVSANYWPRKAVDLCGGSSPNVNNCDFEIFHRLESGGVTANLGTFIDCHSSGNTLGVQFSIDYSDNGVSGGVTDSLMFSNIAVSDVVKVTKRSKAIYDSSDKTIAYLNGSAATTIVANTGYSTTASVLAFDAPTFTTYSNPIARTLPATSLVNGTVYKIGFVGTTDFTLIGAASNTVGLTFTATGPGTGTGYVTLSTFTAPRQGLYEFTLKLPMAVAVGTRIRLGFWDGVNAHGTVYGYQANAGTQTYSTTAQIVMNAGDTIRPIADQNTAGAVAVSINFHSDECQFTAKAL